MIKGLPERSWLMKENDKDILNMMDVLNLFLVIDKSLPCCL